MRILRKLLSILLLALFGLPLVSPLFAVGQEGTSNLPACCRKGGRHHCMQSGMEQDRQSSHSPQLQGPIERCPYCPGPVVAVHPNPLATPTSDALFSSMAVHPSGIAQTESKRRIARDRSRQKRGPPSILVS
jgi:hypothetical protein